MSWSEIKKAVNSDLSKPLNELITRKSYNKHISATYSSNQLANYLKYQTIANVVGSGKIHSIAISNQNDNFMIAKISVDDEVIFNATFSKLSMAEFDYYRDAHGSTACTVFGPDSNTGTMSDGANRLLYTGNIQDGDLKTTDLPFVNESKNMGRGYFVLNEPIIFNKSFKIEVKFPSAVTSKVANYCSVLYNLNE